MPPNGRATGVIDLTGDDEDDDWPPSQTHGTSQTASNTKQVNASQRPDNGFIRGEIAASPSLKVKGNQEGNHRKSTDPNAARSPHLSSTQVSQSRKSQETHTNGSSRAHGKNASSQRAPPQTINLDSDSENEGRVSRQKPPTEFVVPRDYEPPGSTKLPKTGAGLLSLFSGSSKRRKRSSERASPLLEGSPRKKFKSSQRDGGKGTALSTPTGSRDNNSDRTPIEGLVRRESPKSKPSGVRGEVNLVSPERPKLVRPQPDRGDQFESIETPRGGSPDVSLNHPAAMPSQPRSKDQSSTLTNGNSSQKQMTPSGHSTSITLREQRTPGTGTNAANEDVSAAVNSRRSPASKPDSRSDRREDASKSNGFSSTAHNGAREPSKRDEVVPREGRERLSGSPYASSQQRQAQRRDHDRAGERPPSERNGVSRGANSDRSPSKLSRHMASHDDEGHESSDQDNDDHFQRPTRKDSESRTAGRQHLEDSALGSKSKNGHNNTRRMDDEDVEINSLSEDEHRSIDRHRDAIRAASQRYSSPRQAASRDAMLSGQISHPPRTQSKEILITAPEFIERVKSEDVLSRKVNTDAEDADSQLRMEAMQGDIENAATRETDPTFAPPTISASALKSSSMYSNLPLANRVEKVLGKYLEELRGDNEYWTSVSMRRARLTKEEERSESFLEASEPSSTELTSFAHLKPLKLSPHKKGSIPTRPDNDIWGIQRITADGKHQPPTDFSAAYTTIASDREDVPDYAHYVSIKSNMLAPNVIYLHCWPYFGDDFDTSKAQNLNGSYKIDIMEREGKLLLLLKAQKYQDYVESALQEIDCTWADVLRFLLAKNPDVGSDLDARKAYQNRGQFCQEDFSRSSERWLDVLEQLPPSTPEKLGRAAVLCENFQKMAKFSIWQIARRSEFAKLAEETDLPAHWTVDDNSLTCRICLRFNCPYHGQFKHRDDDSDSESDAGSVLSAETVVATDIIHPLKTNYQSRVAFPPDRSTTPNVGDVAPVQKRKKDANYWNNYQHKPEERGPFYPCHHPGTSCENAKCRCFKRNIPCEKSCSCPSSCPRKFQGCACGSRKGGKLVCLEDPDCACWQHGRECDPDLCGPCGVCDVVDPLNKNNDGILIGRCRNASIQRGVPKLTLLGDSGVHGLGLYACENIKMNEFVGEYKGEIITKKEADRRGAVYEHQKLSYLFSLNKSQEIDSTYFGNKPRFINHAHGDKANLYPRIIMVNTVHRIGLYAGKDILAGKELLFDYGPYFPNEQLQGKKSKKSVVPPESKKSAPHVRNANLVKSFFDVEESEDEDGILRAKAVSHTSAGAKRKPQSSKPQARPRNGIGRKPQGQRAGEHDSVGHSSSSVRNLGQAAGERLAAFNISDDLPSEAMEPDLDGGAEDDEAFEPEGSESDDSEASGSHSNESRGSGSDDDEDDEGGPARARMRRPVVRMRTMRRG